MLLLPDTPKKLADQIAAFLERSQMSKTRFGKDMAGDPNLVEDLRRGRNLRHSLLVRILEKINAE